MSTLNPGILGGDTILAILHGMSFYDLFPNLCDLDPTAHEAIDVNKLKDDCSGHQKVRENFPCYRIQPIFQTHKGVKLSKVSQRSTSKKLFFRYGKNTWETFPRQKKTKQTLPGHKQGRHFVIGDNLTRMWHSEAQSLMNRNASLHILLCLENSMSQAYNVSRGKRS